MPSGSEERCRGHRVASNGGTEEPAANRAGAVEAEPVGGRSETSRLKGRGRARPESASGADEAFVESGAPVEAGGGSVADVGQPMAVLVQESGVGTLTSQDLVKKSIARRRQPTGDVFSRSEG